LPNKGMERAGAAEPSPCDDSRGVDIAGVHAASTTCSSRQCEKEAHQDGQQNDPIQSWFHGKTPLFSTNIKMDVCVLIRFSSCKSSSSSGSKKCILKSCKI